MFLFTRADGKHWAHSEWDGLVRQAAQKAGLLGVCLYTLRHSFITQALIDGMRRWTSREYQERPWR